MLTLNIQEIAAKFLINHLSILRKAASYTILVTICLKIPKKKKTKNKWSWLKHHSGMVISASDMIKADLELNDKNLTKQLMQYQSLAIIKNKKQNKTESHQKTDLSNK